MTFLHLMILSFIQGFSETLPVSSSAHLIIAHTLFGNMEVGSLYFDIGLHIGTLLAVMIVFKADTLALIKDSLKLLALQKINNNISLNIILATLPVIVFGLLFVCLGIEQHIRILPIIAFNLIFFGILLYIADKYSQTNLAINRISKKQALITGCAQVLALIPGVSRSGICLTASRFLGVNKTDAVRFSMLLSIPTISAAALSNITQIKNANFSSFDISIGIIFSFIFGFIFIKLLLAFVRKFSFKIFMLYRIILGLILLAYIIFS